MIISCASSFSLFFFRKKSQFLGKSINNASQVRPYRRHALFDITTVFAIYETLFGWKTYSRQKYYYEN